MSVIVLNARKGHRFRVLNRGEDVQTFTEVEEFGGGIVQASTNWFAHRR